MHFGIYFSSGLGSFLVLPATDHARGLRVHHNASSGPSGRRGACSGSSKPQTPTHDEGDKVGFHTNWHCLAAAMKKNVLRMQHHTVRKHTFLLITASTDCLATSRSPSHSGARVLVVLECLFVLFECSRCSRSRARHARVLVQIGVHAEVSARASARVLVCWCWCFSYSCSCKSDPVLGLVLYLSGLCSSALLMFVLEGSCSCL